MKFTCSFSFVFLLFAFYQMGKRGYETNYSLFFGLLFFFFGNTIGALLVWTFISDVFGTWLKQKLFNV